ncbi:MAG: helix-turn-helix domain-containing protein [Ruminococcaceae bacterium]|nr:helix-turn-helix domain-containing protein [Oscillospiraceae bacterium]
MEYANLSNLIAALEYGTQLHISVVFLNHYGNEKTRLPFAHRIHTCPVCDKAKQSADGFASCYRCRNTVLKWCIRRKRSLGGFCAKGVYEYCRPVIRHADVLCVIFIGNILTDSDQQRLTLAKHVAPSLLRTMQENYTERDCAQVADLLESYLFSLFETYGYTLNEPTDALIDNIKSYITENLSYDFSMADLSSVFNYNPKYLGRLFKSKTGYSVKEYCNNGKIETAKHLLKNSRLSVLDISAQAGFNNVTYFDRQFRKHTGLSPREYRSKNTP